MPMSNIFNNPAFNMASLTDAINVLPNQYGLLNQLNLFPVTGSRSRTVMIEYKNGVLNLLPSLPPGSPGTLGTVGKREVRSFIVPHIPHDDTVLPQDYMDLRGFGSESQLESVANVVNDKLQTMKNKHDITLEYMRMGALKGVIIDGAGSVVYDLHAEFGIAAKTVDFKFSVASTDIKKKCLEVVRHIETNLKGEIKNGVAALVSPEFFDALTSHAKVEAAYNRWMDGAALRNDMRGGFPFGGMNFVEYSGEASDYNGALNRFIAVGEGHAYPTGTAQTFSTYVSPADFVETANTLGLLYYAKQASRKFERGIDLHTQSNPLPLCKRPALLVRLTMS